MLDLETLGTSPGSVVFAIAAVPFDFDKGVLPPAAVEGMPEAGNFYRLIDPIRSAWVYGLERDTTTMEWWTRQPKAAQAQLDAALQNGDSLFPVLEDFRAFLAPYDPTEVRIWGNGAAFDNVLLAELYRRLKLDVPWKFYNDRCFRTLKNLYGAAVPAVRPDVPHHALSDARAQAQWAVNIARHRHAAAGA